MIIDGKEFAQTLRQKLTQQIETIKKSHNIIPGLAVVLVGEDPASHVYVRNKEKFAIECGMHSVTYRKEATTTEQELLKLIDTLNHDSNIHGILVQLPLPKHICEQTVLQAIAPIKDVDGFHPVNVGKLSIGEPALIPCTPLGSLLLLKTFEGDLTRKNAVIIGRSNIVGKPMAQLLLRENCTVTIAHSKTQQIENVCRNADIIVAAVGRPLLVKSSWVKEGATIIDVGINRIQEEEKTRLVGDVDFEDVKEKVKYITPVPGGVGPMTIACLLQNAVTAMCLQNNIKDPNQL